MTAVLLSCLALSGVALADSTTGTTVTVAGKPVAGKQVVVTVVVTGSHLVDGHLPSVPGGDVQLTLNGALVGQVRASEANSTLYDSGCVDISCGLYTFKSRNTTVTIPVTLPRGMTTYQFVGAYTGDHDSHASTSPSVVLKPIYPDVSAATSLLLN
ncbi:MAG: hypothetical protein WBW32_01290 [Luteibacter sp.]